MLGKLKPAAGLRAAFATLFAVVGPERPRIAGSIALAVAGSLLYLGLPLLIRPITHDFIEGDSAQALDALYRAALGILVLLVLQNALLGSLTWLQTTTGERIARRLRAQVYRALLGAKQEAVAGVRRGEIASRIGNDVSIVQALATTQLTGLIRSLVLFAAGVGLMLYLQRLVTLQALFGAAFVGLCAGLAIGPVKRLSVRLQQLRAEMSSEAVEAFTNRVVIVLFGGRETAMRRFTRLLDEAYGVVCRRATVNGFVMACINVVGTVVFGLIIFSEALRVATGVLPFADFISYLTAVMLMASGAGQASGSVNGMVQGFAGLRRVLALAALPLEDASAAATGPSGVPFAARAITLEDVTFAHAGAKAPALDGVSLTIPAQTLFGITGPSGSGKSTLASLLLRLEAPQRGRILVDGTDVRSIPLGRYREALSFVPQDPYVFAATIEENIVFGRAGVSREAMERAAAQAGVASFVKRLRLSYDTPVAEGGNSLSRGECQRIAIARALIGDPEVLVLDEPTASLDGENERAFLAALERFRHGRTVILITHRLDLLAAADAVAVLLDGALVEHGTFSELLARRGTFAQLYGSHHNAPPEALAV
jgi:ATP-binding cassette subfamily B protein